MPVILFRTLLVNRHFLNCHSHRLRFGLLWADSAPVGRPTMLPSRHLMIQAIDYSSSVRSQRECCVRKSLKSKERILSALHSRSVLLLRPSGYSPVSSDRCHSEELYSHSVPGGFNHISPRNYNCCQAMISVKVKMGLKYHSFICRIPILLKRHLIGQKPKNE